MTRALALLAALTAICGLRPAFAGPPLNSQPNIRLAEFLAEPAAVAVDVVDLSTGTQVANNVAATQVQRDSADSIAWKYDLATVSGYPTGCAPKTYLVTFVPDSANCSEAGTPEVCASEIVQVGGSSCLAETSPISVESAYATAAIPGQGIAQSVVDFHARRGLLALKWRKIRVAADLDYATPDATFWEVYFWTDGNASPRIKCTVVTTSDPAVSLPSSAHCG